MATTPQFKHLRLDINNGIAEVVFNRPNKLNTMTLGSPLFSFFFFFLFIFYYLLFLFWFLICLSLIETAFFDEIGQVFKVIDEDKNVKVAIVWAEGKMFTAGLDLKDASGTIFNAPGNH